MSYYSGEPVDSNWVYGGIFPGEGDFSIIYQTKPKIEKFTVYSDTVGQFTGLTDKNGTRVFEGDIVNYNGSCHKVVFESRNGTGYFGIVVGENETWGFGNSTPAYMMTVVGNIHDNADLLGENNVKEQ